MSNSLWPMNCSLPGSSVHGILQARILEWVAIPFSRSSSWPRDWTLVSCIGGRFFTIEPPGKPDGVYMYISLSNLMKLWAMPCSATQDGWVMVEDSDKTWSTGEGNGKPLQYSRLENPMNSMKRQKDRTLKDELPRVVGAQYATGEEWRNNSRKWRDRAKAKTTPSCGCNWWRK